MQLRQLRDNVKRKKPRPKDKDRKHWKLKKRDRDNWHKKQRRRGLKWRKLQLRPLHMLLGKNLKDKDLLQKLKRKHLKKSRKLMKQLLKPKRKDRKLRKLSEPWKKPKLNMHLSKKFNVYKK